MSNELVVSDELVTALDGAVETGLLAQKEASQFKRTMLVSKAIGTLQNLLTPLVMEPIMNLQNTALGFFTDQRGNGYPAQVVRDCLIEATLKGVFPVGNEFNIIASRCYITKEGYFHKLRDIPNFTWIETPGIPRMQDKGAIISVKLEWTLNKKSFDKELELAIRVNNGMGADAIIGKALRKARAWLFTTVTGQDVGDGDVDDYIDIKPAKTSIFETQAEQPKAEQPQPVAQADWLAEAIGTGAPVTVEEVRAFACSRNINDDNLREHLPAIIDEMLNGDML